MGTSEWQSQPCLTPSWSCGDISGQNPDPQTEGGGCQPGSAAGEEGTRPSSSMASPPLTVACPRQPSQHCPCWGGGLCRPSGSFGPKHGSNKPALLTNDHAPRAWASAGRHSALSLKRTDLSHKPTELPSTRCVLRKDPPDLGQPPLPGPMLQLPLDPTPDSTCHHVSQFSGTCPGSRRC